MCCPGRLKIAALLDLVARLGELIAVGPVAHSKFVCLVARDGVVRI